MSFSFFAFQHHGQSPRETHLTTHSFSNLIFGVHGAPSINIDNPRRSASLGLLLLLCYRVLSGAVPACFKASGFGLPRSSAEARQRVCNVVSRAIPPAAVKHHVCKHVCPVCLIIESLVNVRPRRPHNATCFVMTLMRRDARRPRCTGGL